MSGIERSSPAALERYQLERLRRLLAELAAANAFYAPRLRAAGLDRGVASLAEYARRMPFTTKAELAADQEAHPPFGTIPTYSLECYERVHLTSGTSGTPLRWLDTRASWSALVDLWRRVFEAAGVGPDERVFFAFSFGPFIGFWLAWDAAARLGCLCISGGALTSAMRLRSIVDNRATVVCATPTYALRLGELARAERVDVGHVRRLIVAGEPGGSLAPTRARLAELWPGAAPFDHHGMTEVGPVTFECPAEPGVLHVMESDFVCEVVEPETGEPIDLGHLGDPGASGELVLSGLGRAGSPLLRYRTGDRVHAAPRGRCACGLVTLRLIGGILARGDDMVVVRGVNLYPGAVDQIVRRAGGVEEYRVEVRTERAMAEVAVLVEPVPDRAGGAPALCRELEQAFREALDLRIPVRAAAPGELPRFELKARRWVRVGAPDGAASGGGACSNPPVG